MIVRFGVCEVDLDRVEIRRESELVAVEPQVFDVLAYLIDHRDRLVPKEELLDNIWGDRFVSESALTSRIKSARQAVGDDGKAQAVIRTVHGRGYRFVAEVTTVDAVASTAATPPVGTTVSSDGGDRARPGSARSGTARPGAAPEWPIVGRHDQLEQLESKLHDPSCRGVLVTGPAGIGKTRLAEECARLAAAAGFAVARVQGSADTRSVPLASIAHLLPSQIVDEVTQSGELARSVVLLRARAAVEDLAAGRRLVLLVDQADRLDELSTALIASLAGSTQVFLVLTQRTSTSEPVLFDDLVRGRQIVRLDLVPLDETDLDVLLYRVLEGPIDLGSLEQLTSLAHGTPGALAELVEAALADRVLDGGSGVWRIVGPLRPTVTVPGHDHIDVDRLDPAAVEAAEILSLAEDLELDLAVEMFGSAALDVLDEAGLLAVDEVDGRARISLAHEHVRLLLLDRLGPLRERRHKSRLARQATDGLSSRDRFRVVRWAIETGTPPGRDEAVDAARHAVAVGDHDSAEIVLDHLDHHAPGPDALMLRAEIAFRQGLTETTERILAEISTRDLDPESAMIATRRRASILFQVRNRFDDALELLADAQDGAVGDAASIVASYRVLFEANFGRADEALRLADTFDPPSAPGQRLEVLRGLARARMLRGELDAALELLAEHQELLADDTTTAAAGWSEHAKAMSLICHSAAGRLRRSAQLVRELLPYGRRTVHAMLPIAAARIELTAGRPRSARSVINTPLAAVRSHTLRHTEPLMTALVARTHLALDEREPGARLVAEAAEWIDELDGLPRFSLVRELAVAWTQLGDEERAVAEALRAAARAREFGAALSEAELLAVAGTGGAALEVTHRLDELADRIEGPLWTLRARHVRAIAESAPASEYERIETEYRTIGEIPLADAVAADLAHR